MILVSFDFYMFTGARQVGLSILETTNPMRFLLPAVSKSFTKWCQKQPKTGNSEGQKHLDHERSEKEGYMITRKAQIITLFNCGDQQSSTC